jgi:hypothetical protein
MSALGHSRHFGLLARMSAFPERRRRKAPSQSFPQGGSIGSAGRNRCARRHRGFSRSGKGRGGFVGDFRTDRDLIDVPFAMTSVDGPSRPAPMVVGAAEKSGLSGGPDRQMNCRGPFDGIGLDAQVGKRRARRCVPAGLP